MDNQTHIKWHWHCFDELSSHQTEKLFALRQQVFMLEQNCLYLDIDGKDSAAKHLLVWDDNELIATLRVFESYKEYSGHASIGRICVSKKARKSGLGKLLVQHAIDYIKEHFSRKEIQIGAQYYLKSFYETLGFKQTSEPYDEDGIEHIHMNYKFTR